MTAQLSAEQLEINAHRSQCNAARNARGDHGRDRSHGCYWGDDGWWISCDAEIMRRWDRTHEQIRRETRARMQRENSNRDDTHSWLGAHS
jgi:hypothetical protein